MVMIKSRKIYKLVFELRASFGMLLLLLLIGCQPETSPVIVTRSTPEPTKIPLATPVPSLTATFVAPPPTETVVTAVPTIPPTIEPTAVPPSPTAAGWQINDRSSFLIRKERNDIYLLRPGQTSQHITPGKLVVGQPWSPDGTKFIFDSSSTFEADPPPELAMADLETGQTSVINLLRKPYDIYWSPDGKYLLYTNDGENNAIQIVLYDFSDGENKVILEIVTEDDWYLFLTGWSPDSQKIAFVTSMNNQVDLFVLEIESLAISQLTNTPEYETIAVWSTTDDRLLFGTKDNYEHALEVWPWGASTLYLIDDSGENLTRLSDSYYYSAAWSPDGQKIAYSDGGQICILDVENQTEVCPLKDVLPYNEYYASLGDAPAWSSDGNWLAFQATGHEEGQCYRVYFWELSTNLVTPVDVSTCGVDPFYWSIAEMQ